MVLIHLKKLLHANRTACSKFLGARLARVFLLILLSSAPLTASSHKHKRDYGLGFSTEVAAPESVLLQVVQEVTKNGVIEGSKEYNKDKEIEKADSADSSPLFAKWNQPGKVFYKVREKVLAPVNFEDSNDEGTLAVRYVVQSKDSSRSILKIDAVFVEDFRHTVHLSDGSVESAEFKAIQDRVDAIDEEKKQAAEAEKHREEELARQMLERKQSEEQAQALATAQASGQTVEEHLANLRHQVERVIKAPGAQLRSAPFHTASTLKSLNPGAEVVILIVTPYWYGVETEDGQHGWILREQLESLP